MQIPISQIKKRGQLFYFNDAVMLFIRHGVLSGIGGPCKAITLTEYRTIDAHLSPGTSVEISPHTLVELVEADFYIEKQPNPILRVFLPND